MKKLNKMFEVKADEEGWAFIKMLRKSLNKDSYYINIRGRHTNRKLALGDKYVPKNSPRPTPNDIPLSKAERIAIYVYKKDAQPPCQSGDGRT